MKTAFDDLLGLPDDPIDRTPFGKHSVVDGEFQIGPEARLQQSIVDPGSKHALPAKTVERITNNRIRGHILGLLDQTHEEALIALRKVMEMNPKLGLELWIDMAQFATPKLKALAVKIQDGDTSAANSLRGASIEDLQRLVSEQ